MRRVISCKKRLLSPGSHLFADGENISGNNFLRPGRNICRFKSGLIESGTNAGACFFVAKQYPIFLSGPPTAWVLTFDV